MTATLFFVTNIVVLYNAYNREPQTWFCVIRQISRISKSGVFKGGISPSGLSPLALYADYPFIIRSYAIYIGQEKPPDGTSYISSWTSCMRFAYEINRIICHFRYGWKHYCSFLFCLYWKCSLDNSCLCHVSYFNDRATKRSYL